VKQVETLAKDKIATKENNLKDLFEISIDEVKENFRDLKKSL
jgi:hypothetical protein